VSRKNISINHARRRFELLNCAIAYDCQTVRFQEGTTRLNGKVGSEGREVAALTLSGLLHKFQLGDYALICDVEGAEAENDHRIARHS